jgi:hypothetical protein
MRILVVKPRAEKSMNRVAEFVELINLPHSGDKWFNHAMDFLEELASSSVKQFPLCHHPKLAAKNYSCRTYKKKWVVVFKYNETNLTVHRFVLGAKLK